MNEQELDILRDALGEPETGEPDVKEVQELAEDEPRGEDEQDRQPQVQESSSSLPEDWSKDPNFRKWQSDRDKEVSAERKAREELERRLQAIEAERAAQQAEIERRYLEEASDEERWQFMLQRERAAREQAQQQLWGVQEEMRRFDVVSGLAEKTGAPVDYFKDARNWQEAYDLALQYQRQDTDRKAEEKAEQRTRERNAATVDLGSGRPSLPDDVARLRDRYMKRKDATSYVKDLIL